MIRAIVLIKDHRYERQARGAVLHMAHQDFEELRYAIVALGHINEAIENIVDRLPDECPVWHEFPCAQVVDAESAAVCWTEAP